MNSTWRELMAKGNLLSDEAMAALPDLKRSGAMMREANRLRTRALELKYEVKR